jgi:hypothetical protein
MACFPDKEIIFPCIEQGADWVRLLTVKDVDENPINLTGTTAKMQFRRNYESPPVITLTNSSGITLGGALGTIKIQLDNSVTALVDESTLLFDLFITWSTGAVDRLFYGQVNIDKSVTRD